MPTVRIDTSQLTFPLYRIHPTSMGFVDGSTTPPPGIALDPGTYLFQQTSGIFADFEFTVSTAGTVDYGTEFDGFLTGRGTDTLGVGGFPVRLDGTALDHGLFPMLAGSSAFLMPDQVHELVLTPSTQYGLQPGSGLVQLPLRRRPQWTRRRAAGVRRVRHRRRDPHPHHLGVHDHHRRPLALARPVAGAAPPRQRLPARATANPLTLIPAAGYGVQPGSGIVADMSFTLGVDGLIDFPTSCDGFLTGRGTSTLAVGGYPVLVDATQADSDLLTVANIPIPADTPRFLFAVLVPAAGYQPQTTNGVFGHGFNIERDGTVTFDPALAGQYVISSVPRLEILGPTPF